VAEETLEAANKAVSCERKVKHPTRQAAERAAEVARRVWGPEYKAYECGYCGGFHVGKPSSRWEGKLERWTHAEGGAAKSLRHQSGHSALEEAVHDALVEAGLAGFRRDAKDLPGAPDFVWEVHCLVLFVHGCYWHSCPACHPGGPKSRVVGKGTNRELWRKKFVSNAERDRKNLEAYASMGWVTVVAWECHLRAEGPGQLVSLVKSVLGAPAMAEEADEG
jgi:DNA mismatch endonuclease (patch repair protein)